MRRDVCWRNRIDKVTWLQVQIMLLMASLITYWRNSSIFQLSTQILQNNTFTVSISFPDLWSIYIHTCVASAWAHTSSLIKLYWILFLKKFTIYTAQSSRDKFRNYIIKLVLTIFRPSLFEWILFLLKLPKFCAAWSQRLLATHLMSSVHLSSAPRRWRKAKSKEDSFRFCQIRKWKLELSTLE